MTKIGDRIELVSMIDDPDPVVSGTQGTVDWVSEIDTPKQWTQIGVKWDNGRRTLSLCCSPDAYRILPG